jgi:predicted  nucleic acid-binding Zn-ribbon protein
LKEEIDELKKRNVELEREYHECRNNYQMLDMKKGIIGRKKERNSSNTSIIEETLNNGMKETNKKLETKITEL